MDNKILKNEYESYVSKQQGISFMQSEKWSKVKTDWLSEQILLKDECGYVHGAVQMLIKKIPFLHTSFIYVPRGPVCDMHDKYAVKAHRAYQAVCTEVQCFYGSDPDILDDISCFEDRFNNIE